MSKDESIKTRDRLYIDSKDRAHYNRLDETNPFKKARHTQFILAMAYGFKNDVRLPLESKDALVLEKDLSEEEMALIYAVALKNIDDEILLNDKNEIYNIAEEYAHAGIKLLIDKIDTSSEEVFWKRVEKDFIELYDSVIENKK